MILINIDAALVENLRETLNFLNFCYAMVWVLGIIGILAALVFTSLDEEDE